MFSSYRDRQELENDLYQGDGEESEGSEAISELEFRLYSQLHYSSNAGELKDQDEEQQTSQEMLVPEKTAHYALSSKTVKQQSKNKSKKSVKQKKGEIVLQGSRTLSPFEEVIVIDSSPEVITISEDDTSDDDKGVCALKGSRKPQMQTSNPVLQASHQELNLITLVKAASSSSSSESESESESELESSHASDSSDFLENWMILGGEQEDGDTSISLNLEGNYDINSGTEVDNNGSWLVTDKDKEAQICNKDGSRRAATLFTNRYYTDKYVLCRNCNKTGHLSKNCPHPKETPCYFCGELGHLANKCPSKHCNNCGRPGHVYESCNERAYFHKQCHRCGMWGHFFDACPEIWRQYHITTKQGPPVKQQGKDNGRSPAYCYNCSMEGHFGHWCTRQRMFKGTYASTPYINHYDTKEDIQRGQPRLMWKVKELRKNGFIPSSFQTAHTPGPPKKKQKIICENNGNIFSRKFALASDKHIASPSHIFFRGDSDFKAASKFNKQKQKKSVGKQWKPKRAVPKERPAPPKLIIDEEADFPRGRGGEKTQKKKKKKKLNQVPLNGAVFRTAPWKSKKEKDEKRKKKIRPIKRISAQMYPTDENLFAIKQRKRKR